MKTNNNIHQIIKVMVCICFVSTFALTAATDFDKDWRRASQDREEDTLSKRLGGEIFYDYFKPSDTYDSRKGLNVIYSAFPKPTLSYSLTAGIVEWQGETDVWVGLGVTNEWTGRFYTYSAISLSSKSEFLPQFRIDNDFNFKFGANRNFVGTVGLTYIDYHTNNEDFVLSLGGTYYYDRFNLSYRFFQNYSSPGSIKSNSHLISAGYGQDKAYWTYLTVTFGNQAYLSQYLTTPEEVRQDVFRISLNHRHWLSRRAGIYGDLGYLKLNDGYDIYSFLFGYFYDF